MQESCRSIATLACNDLLLLRYGWGHRPGDGSGLTDCFQLICEVRRRLGLRDYSPEFEWVYRTYTEQTLGRYSLARWLLEKTTRVDQPLAGDVTLLDAAVNGALAVVSDSGGLLYLRSSGSVVHAPTAPQSLRYHRPLP
jgi:hypothetical protein